MSSEYTKSLMTKRNIFGIISTVLLFGILIALIVILCSSLGTSDTTLKETLGTLLYGALITTIVVSILLVVVGHKVRSVLWMISVILATSLYGVVAMYVVFGIWIVDEYIFFNLYNYYKNKVSINVEIDKR